MNTLDIGILRINNEPRFSVNGRPVVLSTHVGNIFNHLAKAQGDVVLKKEFLDLGYSATENSLKAQMSAIRTAFADAGVEDVILSTSLKYGCTKANLMGGYALNMKAFEKL